MQVALAYGQSKLEETLQQEIPLLEFCKNCQREQTMSTMSTQHASTVGMIGVMDSIPWARCASGNVNCLRYTLSLASIRLIAGRSNQRLFFFMKFVYR